MVYHQWCYPWPMQRLLGTIHGIIGWPIFCFWTACAGVGILLGAVLRPRDEARLLGAYALGLCWGRMMWWTQPFWQRAFAGVEHIPEGPCVFVANHQSAIDIPMLFGLPKPLKLVTKPANYRIPIMGPFFRLSGQISTASFMDEGERAIAAGISVVVFAEGSRSKTGVLRRFKRGAFELAARTGVPVVPIALDGARLIMSKKELMPRQLGVPVVGVIGEPVSGDDPDAIRAVVHARVSEQLDTLRARVQFESRRVVRDAPATRQLG